MNTILVRAAHRRIEQTVQTATFIRWKIAELLLSIAVASAAFAISI